MKKLLISLDILEKFASTETLDLYLNKYIFKLNNSC